jgi:PAS domain S-box-containing protein
MRDAVAQAQRQRWEGMRMASNATQSGGASGRPQSGGGLRAAALVCAPVAALGGVVVLAGWVLEVPLLKSLHPALVTMKANTALCFVLIGAALVLLRHGEAPVPLARRRAALACACVVGLIGALTLCEYALHCDLRIDQMLFREATGAVGTAFPGRMAPNTALNFLLIALALALLDVEAWRRHRPADYLALGVGTITLVALSGYVYDVEALYGRFGRFTPMALHTAVIFLAVSAGLLLARPDKGVVARLRNTGLRFRLMGLVVLAMLPVFGLVLHHAGVERALRLREMQENGLRMAEVSAGSVAQVVEGARQMMVSLACAAPVRELDPPAANRLLSDVLGRSPSYLTIGLAAPGGRLAASGVPVAGAIDYSDRYWFKRAQATRDFAVGEYVVSRATGKPSITVSLPVAAAPDSPPPVLYTALSVSALQRAIAWTHIPPGNVLIVVDRNGVQLARHPGFETWVGHKSNSFLLLLERKRGFAGFIDTTGVDDVRRLYHFVPVRGTEDGIFVGIGLSKTGALAESHAAFRRNLFWLGVATTLALLFAWFLAELSMLAPVRRLAAVSRRLAAGDLAARAGLQGGAREVRQLARDFDDMAVALQQHREHLEDLVRQRTEALTDANKRLAMEIEERQALEDDLERSNRKLEQMAAIVTYSNDAIFSETLDGTVTSWNAAAERMYGYPAGEIVGRNVATLMDEDRAAEVKGLLERIARGEHIEHHETRRRRKDGAIIDVSLTLSPIKDAKGDVVAVSAIARDITERKRAEERLRQVKEDLERSNRELEMFAYVASHDLQEPLRKIKSFTDLLAMRYRGHIDERADKYIAYIVDGAERMQGLIADLLTYSRVGRAEIALAPGPLDDVLDRVLRDLETTLLTAGATVTRDPLPTLPVNAQQIGLVLQNLIANGVKFRATEPPRVHIAARLNGAEWTFSVRDNGIGIDPKYFPQLFQIFHRLHGRHEYPGTGIGLAVCKKIVERHGGRIWVESTPGAGCAFLFTLPAPAGPGAAQPGPTSLS